MSDKVSNQSTASDPTNSLNLATVTREIFEPHVGSSFVCLVEEQTPVELKLIKTIDEHRCSEEELDYRRPFSLIFEAADDTVYPQALREFKHLELGEMQLFIIPFGVFAGKVRYNATFN